MATFETMLKVAKFVRTKELRPYNVKRYFRELLEFRDDFGDARRSGDRNRLWQYYSVPLPMIFAFIFHQYLFKVKLNKFDSYMQMDCMGWINTSRSVYLVASGFHLLSIYYLYILYCSPEADCCVGWIREVVVNDQPVVYHWPYHYKHNSCSKLIQKKFSKIFYFFRSVVIFLSFVLWLIPLFFLKYTWSQLEYFQQNPVLVWKILQFVAIFPPYATGLVLIAHPIVFVEIMFLVEMFIWRMQLWQIDFAISSYNKRRRPHIRLAMRAYQQVLQYIATINRITGKAFTVLLVINVPYSIILFHSAMFDDISIYCRVFLASLAGFVFNYISIVHFIFARRNSQLRKLCYRITITPFHNRMNRLARFKVDLFTQSLFTKQMYGITYWKFGLISMMSFAKVCLSFIFVSSFTFHFLFPVVCFHLLSSVYEDLLE